MTSATPDKPSSKREAVKPGYDLVVGLGRSGMAIARFLNARGQRVIATDCDERKKAVERELAELGIETQIGHHDPETFLNAGRIITSPGIRLDMPLFKDAREKGIPVTGELDLLAGLLDIPLVAVTGTNGKTTVTTLISEMLTASGLRVFTCGNIGTPLVRYFEEPSPADVMVAEISSFQLDAATSFRPQVGVLLNITDDHLDRYDGIEAYADAKWRLFTHQRAGDVAIINSGIPGFSRKASEIKATLCAFGYRESESLIPGGYLTGERVEIRNIPVVGCSGSLVGMNLDLSGSPLVGSHNRENLAAAALAALASGGRPEGIEQVVCSFKGLPHRTQFVGEVDGVFFYNDSKATNPDAVLRALEAFAPGVVLIMGGQSKHTDFACLRDAAAQRVKHLVVTGEAATEIAAALDGCCPISRADSMEDAVRMSFSKAGGGGVALLSPACASFDWYDNYVQRGNDFAGHVKLLGQNLC